MYKIEHENYKIMRWFCKYKFT